MTATINLVSGEKIALAPGDRVELTPRTQHGRSRIDQQGNTWKIADIREKVACKDCTGPFLLLERNDGCVTSDVLNERYEEGGIWLRWVSVNNDPDFRVFKA